MNFKSKKGLIALDIDGTITSDIFHIPVKVSDYLKQLHFQGWEIVFITGRSFYWGFQTLQVFDFPYIFATQNGAVILEMPSRSIIKSQYICFDFLNKLKKVCQEENNHFVMYTGFENEDRCYYLPDCFEPKLLEYLKQRLIKLQESWLPLENLEQFPMQPISSFKCFGRKNEALKLSLRIEKELGLHAPFNRDPYDSEFYIVQVTHPEANKGHALSYIINKYSLKGPIIAAGDDLNDLPMLKKATIKIAMAEAPKALLEMAHIVAPSAKNNGIIQGLQEAISLYTSESKNRH